MTLTQFLLTYLLNSKYLLDIVFYIIIIIFVSLYLDTYWLQKTLPPCNM